jgi:hypothetical protein
MLIETDPIPELRAFVANYKSQREAATAMGISNTFLAMMLKGRSPIPQRVLLKLSLRKAVVRETRKAKP